MSIRVFPPFVLRESTNLYGYSTKCQFAHSLNELRPVPRHPKYKTQLCKTFLEVLSFPFNVLCSRTYSYPRLDPAIMDLVVAFSTPLLLVSLLSTHLPRLSRLRAISESVICNVFVITSIWLWYLVLLCVLCVCLFLDCSWSFMLKNLVVGEPFGRGMALAFIVVCIIGICIAFSASAFHILCISIERDC